MNAPLGPTAALVQSTLMMVAAVVLGIAVTLMLLSHLQHLVSQQNLENTLRAQLSAGTAPVSEGDVDDVLLKDGAPVAVIDIPSIGLHEVIAEGTTSVVLKGGPGHRRDTVLPGQAGLSIVMGRAAAYGGPFARIQELTTGDTFTVITGQGEQTFEVIGVRYAGDTSPAPLQAGESRLTLETARGPGFIPTGVARVDAELVSETKPSGKRQTTYVSMGPSNKELAGDYSSVWALVFAVQLLIIVEVAAVWALVRVGRRKTWVVFTPVAVLVGLLVADQVITLLPNML
ncbi:sortase [Cnuibacter sp. UC19_7]|uniref:sortase n=1 Tax=Cnuibacter sp. UC19_7 TaxID=3350166 RepID=UPI0036730D9B